MVACCCAGSAARSRGPGTIVCLKGTVKSPGRGVGAGSVAGPEIRAEVGCNGSERDSAGPRARRTRQADVLATVVPAAGLAGAGGARQRVAPPRPLLHVVHASTCKSGHPPGRAGPGGAVPRPEDPGRLRSRHEIPERSESRRPAGVCTTLHRLGHPTSYGRRPVLRGRRGSAGGSADQAAARSPSTDRMVSFIECPGTQPTSAVHRPPSTMQRNWMWSSSGGGKLASR
jgi:hypothetical protein